MGAIVPSIVAYGIYTRMSDMKVRYKQQTAVTADVAASLHGMDKNIEAFVRGINVLQMGCEYRNGEGPLEALRGALRRNVQEYEGARDTIYTTLEQSATSLGQETDTQRNALDKLAEIRAKTKEYADKIF